MRSGEKILKDRSEGVKSPGVLNVTGSNYTEKLKYSRTSWMKKHIVKMAHSLSWSGLDGKSCIIHAALSGQTEVLEFGLQVTIEAKNILEVAGGLLREAEVTRMQAIQSSLASDEKVDEGLMAGQTAGDATAVVPGVELSADMSTVSMTNITSTSADRCTDRPPLSAQEVRDQAGTIIHSISTTPVRSSYKKSPVLGGDVQVQGPHHGAGCHALVDVSQTGSKTGSDCDPNTGSEVLVRDPAQETQVSKSQDDVQQVQSSDTDTLALIAYCVRCLLPSCILRDNNAHTEGSN